MENTQEGESMERPINDAIDLAEANAQMEPPSVVKDPAILQIKPIGIGTVNLRKNILAPDQQVTAVQVMATISYMNQPLVPVIVTIPVGHVADIAFDMTEVIDAVLRIRQSGVQPAPKPEPPKPNMRRLLRP